MRKIFVVFMAFICAICLGAVPLAMADTTEELNVKSVSYDGIGVDGYKYDSGTYKVCLDFDGSLATGNINFVQRTDGNLGGLVPVLSDSVREKLFVNGKSVVNWLKELYEDNSDEVNDSSNYFQIHLRESVVSSGVFDRLEFILSDTSNVFDVDSEKRLTGNNTIVFKAGFKTQDESKEISNDITYNFNAVANKWARAGATTVLTDADVLDMGTDYQILLEFDQSGISAQTVGVQQIDASVADCISINGVSIGDIPTGKVVVNWQMTEGKGRLHIYLKKDLEKAKGGLEQANGVIVDDVNTVTISENFVLPTNLRIKEGITVKSMANTFPVQNSRQDGERASANVINVDMTVYPTNVAIDIDFDKPINEYMVNHVARQNSYTMLQVNAGLTTYQRNDLLAATVPSLWNKITIDNGDGPKTIKEYMDMALTDGTSGCEGAVDIHLREDQREKQRIKLNFNNGYSSSLDTTKDIKISFLEGFTTLTANVAPTYFEYDATEKLWLAEGETLPEFSEVKPISIEAPQFDGSANKNVQILVHFDKDITTKEYIYMSVGKELIQAMPVTAEQYSDSDIRKFTKYGILETAQTNFVFNGESIAEMVADTEPISQVPNTACTHYGNASQLNVIRFVIGGEYVDGNGDVVARPRQITDLNQHFVITIKAGLRMPNATEVKETVSFIWDYNSGKWYEGSSVEDIPESEGSGRFDDTDQPKDEYVSDGLGTGALVAIIVGSVVVVGGVVGVFIGLKLKKSKGGKSK